MKKKILSLALAICMVMSLVPAVSASAEEEQAYQLEYDFLNITGAVLKAAVDHDALDFAKTEGTWKFHEMKGFSALTYFDSNLEIKDTGVGCYFAVKINVPYARTYTVKFDYLQNGVGENDETKGDIYLFKDGTDISNLSEVSEENKIGDIATNVDFSTVNSTENPSAELTKDSLYIPAGEQILVFYITTSNGDNSSEKRLRLCKLTLTSGTLADGEVGATVPMYINEASVASVELENGKSTELTLSGWLNDGAAFDANSDVVSFASKNGNVSISGNTVTAVKAGEDIITATVTSGGKSISKDISITVNPTAQEKAEAAFTVSEKATEYTAPSLTGLTLGGAVIDGTQNSDGSFNITAPAAKDNGSKFLYWAKGLTTYKTILLYKTNELKNYIPGENGRELLIAVYEDEVPTTAEYYNANGQLIPGATDSDRPYMAGYGTASGWKQYGKTNIWVAEYNDKTQPDDVTVTVANGTGTATVPYGEKVTCTADETKGTFRWWQKEVNGAQEIVSVDKEYSFLAYEDCTVTTVYGDSRVTVTNPMKIIIDTFGENSVMAEFIGFGNTVEKGIMWNDVKIPMTAPGNQFTVTADKAGTNTFVGYAIVSDGDNYTLITDGEATVTLGE